ncbi:MAG: glutathione S-transferase [Proteobacteria bacterium]|nr:glutathione S-transferase [Pseudomonadota bacterium]
MPNSIGHSAAPVRLIGHEFSLYSGKARAYLRYKQIPFIESSTPEDRALISERVGRRVIPVVVTPDGECVQDTTEIIDYFEQRYPEPSVYPAGAWQRLVSLLFEVYGDEWLVLPAMHYRWHFKRQNLAYVLRNFGDIIKPGWPRLLRPIGGLPAAMVFGNLYKPVMGRSRRNIGEVEKSYESFLDDFSRHLEDHEYLQGSRPGIGDFGLIGPLYAHLYRDPYPGALMRQRAPNVAQWVERMQHPVRFDGSFLADDQVPVTLYPMLRRMFDEQLPVLVDTLRRVGRWAEEHPDAKGIPRFIGKHEFTLGEVTATRYVMPFAQWMFQRPLAHYQSLSVADKARIDPILDELGGLGGLQEPVAAPLKFADYRLRLDRQADTTAG